MVISLIAIMALVFIVIWIKKQRNTKNDKNQEKIISSGPSEISDHKSDHIIRDNVR